MSPRHAARRSGAVPGVARAGPGSGSGPAGPPPPSTSPSESPPRSAGSPAAALVTPLPRGSLRIAAVLAAATAVLLGAAAVAGRPELLVVVAVLQGVLAAGWVVGTGQPTPLVGLSAGLAAAGAVDGAVLVRHPASLTPMLGVLAVVFPALLLVQLGRRAPRRRLTESLSGAAALTVAGTAPAAYLVLARTADGPRLAAAAGVSAALGLAVALLVDTVLPVPRFADGVPHGVLAVLAAAATGAGTGVVCAAGVPAVTTAGGAVLGATTATLAALVEVGVGFTAATAAPAADRPARRTGWAVLAMRVAVPVAVVAPAAYLLALAVGG